MSLILDALRRAERARERDLGRRLGDAMPPRAPRATGWWPVGAAILVIAVVAGIAVLALRTPPAPPTNEAVSVAPVPVELTPAVATPSRGSSLAEIALPEPDPEPATESAPVYSTAPLLGELPASIRSAIPEVMVNAHYWTDQAERRFVMLDMVRYREGDTVSSGLRVIAVVPDGVEMDWRGTRFRVPAR
jgi:general secretion pathway protein B